MKYLFQFTIIGVITAIGELLNLLLPLPVPASIYGLVLLFVLLCTKVIRLEQVENAADFFLTIMPILFVPPTVKLMGYWDILKDNVIGLVITCVVSTLLVMGITGAIAQWIMKHGKARRRAAHGTGPSEPTGSGFSDEALDEMGAAEISLLESEGVPAENIPPLRKSAADKDTTTKNGGHRHE